MLRITSFKNTKLLLERKKHFFWYTLKKFAWDCYNQSQIFKIYEKIMLWDKNKLWIWVNWHGSMY